MDTADPNQTRSRLAAVLTDSEYNAQNLDGKVRMLETALRLNESEYHKDTYRDPGDNPNAVGRVLVVKHGAQIEMRRFACHMNVDARALPTLVTNYLQDLQTGLTDRLCRCAWAPASVGVQRATLADVNPMCWVHSPEGRVIGFFEWLVHDDANEPSRYADTPLSTLRKFLGDDYAALDRVRKSLDDDGTAKG